MNTYIVISPSEREITVKAKNSAQAKRQACRFWGIKASDEWRGMSAMTAKKIK